MATFAHFTVMLLWLTHLEGSRKNTQEKPELLGLRGKGKERSRMAVAPSKLFITLVNMVGTTNPIFKRRKLKHRMVK